MGFVYEITTRVKENESSSKRKAINNKDTTMIYHAAPLFFLFFHFLHLLNSLQQKFSDFFSLQVIL